MNDPHGKKPGADSRSSVPDPRAPERDARDFQNVLHHIWGAPTPPQPVHNPALPPFAQHVAKPQALPTPPPPKGRRREVTPTQRIDERLDACLPRSGVIREYVAYACALTHTPPENHLAAILPAVATETLRRGWTVEGHIQNVWCAIVAGPALGKTTALTLAQEFVTDWLKDSQNVLYQDPYVAFEGSLPGVIHVLKQRETPHGCFATLYHSEFSRVLRHEESLEFLCLMFDTGKLERNLRKDQDAAKEGDANARPRIEKPRLSALVTMTKGSLEEVFRESMLSGGLGARLLWFTAELTAEKLMHRQRSDPEGRTRLLKSWCDWSATLDQLAYGLDYERQPVMATISYEADEAFIAFFDTLRPLIVSEDETGSLAMRAMAYAERIAGLYALSMGQTSVDLDTAQRAICLVRQSLTNVGSLRPILKANQDQRLAERLYQVIAKSTRNGTTRTELAKVVQLPKQQLDVALEILTASERVMEHVVSSPTGRGRHSTRYYANEFAPGVPKLHVVASN